jgi:hypothetical protein
MMVIRGVRCWVSGVGSILGGAHPPPFLRLVRQYTTHIGRGEGEKGGMGERENGEWLMVDG